MWITSYTVGKSVLKLRNKIVVLPIF
uniref:Uncharacterized protein n=1 Tax=Heterorhabditis bacteriophora TaxID=37862 RepID=A0A1I7WJN8_HETBA